jgi:predicted metallopeptidase
VTIHYGEADDVKRLTTELIETLRLDHVDPHRVHCYRSEGSRAKLTIARIHGLGRLWQKALNAPPAYIIEVIAERYDRLGPEDREKTLIHELLHIPKGFRGGFRPHPGHVTRDRIERLHAAFKRRRTRRA